MCAIGKIYAFFTMCAIKMCDIVTCAVDMIAIGMCGIRTCAIDEEGHYMTCAVGNERYQDMCNRKEVHFMMFSIGKRAIS